MESFLPFEISVYEALALMLILLVASALAVRSLRRFSLMRRYATVVDADNGRLSVPSLSVIVHTFNCDAQSLERNIPRIMEQDYPDFEVIIVNVGGSEDVNDALTRLSGRFPGLRTTFVPRSSSNVSKRKLAITLGIKAAKNDIVVITSAGCVPSGRLWLRSIARHFGESADIVLGAVRHDYEADRGFGHRYRAYDEVTSTSRYLTAAARGHVYRGNGGNIAYRKQLFFDNKGFSSTLNMKYGDDDIFVSEISRGREVAVEFSEEAVLTESCADFSVQFRRDKEHRFFTLKQVRSVGSITVWLSDIGLYLLWLLALLAVVYGACLSLDGVWEKGLAIGAVALFAFLSEAIIHILCYRRIARLLLAPALSLSIPFLRLARPIVDISYRMRASKAANYTWE